MSKDLGMVSCLIAIAVAGCGGEKGTVTSVIHGGHQDQAHYTRPAPATAAITNVDESGVQSSLVLEGVVHRRHAHGGLRYQGDDQTHGRCTSDGRLVWLVGHH